MGEVKFIFRQQFSKVWGCEGVNYYSPEAKFTYFWHLLSLFEMFEEVTSKPEKAPFEKYEPLHILSQLGSKTHYLGTGNLLQLDIRQRVPEKASFPDTKCVGR